MDCESADCEEYLVELNLYCAAGIGLGAVYIVINTINMALASIASERQNKPANVYTVKCIPLPRVIAVEKGKRMLLESCRDGESGRGEEEPF